MNELTINLDSRSKKPLYERFMIISSLYPEREDSLRGKTPVYQGFGKASGSQPQHG